MSDRRRPKRPPTDQHVRYWPTTKAYLALGRETVPADVIDTDRELGLLPPPRGPR